MTEFGKFQVLALSGGGIRGVYSAAVIATLEEKLGKPVIDSFDLVTGTSTGAIIALGLSLGKSGQEILDFYKEEGPGLFPSPKLPKCLRWLHGMRKPRYSQANLITEAKRFFGESTLLGESTHRLVIPSFNVGDGKTVCFKTSHHPDLKKDYKRKVWEFAVAASSAPTYFAPYKTTWGQTLIDGGIWANEPSVLSIVEAINRLGVHQDRLHVLSIGTASSRKVLTEDIGGGKFHWGLKHGVHEIIMQATECGELFKAEQMLNPSQFMRIDTEPRVRIELDNARAIPLLEKLGREKAASMLNEIDASFLRHKAEPFVPCHRLPSL